jgi:hypothetical protein
VPRWPQLGTDSGSGLTSELARRREQAQRTDNPVDAVVLWQLQTMDAPPSEIAATAETVHHELVAMSVQSDRVANVGVHLIRRALALSTTCDPLARLLRVPGRVIRHAGQLTVRLPPTHQLLDEVLPACAPYPQLTDQGHIGPEYPGTSPTQAKLVHSACP